MARYQQGCEVPTDVLVKRLGELSTAIADRDMSELTMQVPARWDRDADLIMVEAARRIKEMEEIISRIDR